MPADVETMMYANELPWHGLGTYVGDNPILAEEAIVAAGLDWGVAKVPAIGLYEDDEGTHECMTDEFFFNVRTTDKKVLGAVQGRYSVLQNHEAFEFMDSMTGPKNLVRYHTAGSLRGGKHIWLLASLTQLTIEPLPGDITEPYVLLVNGHDGRMPLKALFTSVRVVCSNTLNLALSSAKGGVTIRHTGDMMSKAKAARKILGLAEQEVVNYREIADRLAKKKMGDKVFAQFLDQLVPIAEGEESTRKENMRGKLTELFEAGPGTEIPGVRGTAWGALQAVTDYSSHHKTVRGSKGSDKLRRERYLESSWFGSGSSLNEKALKILVEA